MSFNNEQEIILQNIANLFIENKQKAVSLNQISFAVRLVHKLHLEQLKSSKRDIFLVNARIDFVHLALELTHCSTTQIAKYLNRHHTIVCHYKEKISSDNYSLIKNIITNTKYTELHAD